ncbi:MAG: hypothetical protein U9N45_04270 [Gemmatimonadota bacterium]|nr:hypothetical protein [Gemmatimonadota bacterium]
MKNFIYSAFITSFCILLTAGCTSRSEPNPNEEFGRYINGKKLKAKGLGDPIGYIHEHESGFSLSYSCSVVFPLKSSLRGPVPRPGIVLELVPDKIETGREISFSSGDMGNIRLEYHPAGGHKMSESILLVYSSGRKDGGGKVIIDVLEPRPGGRLKGRIIQAKLHAGYEDMNMPGSTEPEKPKVLELFNWPFDVTLKSGPF